MVQAPVPLIVLSGREDDVELVNRSLRDGGHPVRCHWVAKVDKLLAALQELGPQLLCFFPDSLPVAVREIAKIKQHVASAVPLIVVSKVAQEADIAEALLAGAQDLVSLGHTDRLRSNLRFNAQKMGTSEAELEKTRMQANPAKRFGTIDEFGAACAFLCSVHAGYITGQNLLMDGGAFPGTL